MSATALTVADPAQAFTGAMLEDTSCFLSADRQLQNHYLVSASNLAAVVIL